MLPLLLLVQTPNSSSYMQLLICLLQRLRSLPEALRIFVSTEWASVYLALCQQTLRFIQPQEEFSESPLGKEWPAWFWKALIASPDGQSWVPLLLSKKVESRLVLELLGTLILTPHPNPMLSPRLLPPKEAASRLYQSPSKSSPCQNNEAPALKSMVFRRQADGPMGLAVSSLTFTASLYTWHSLTVARTSIRENRRQPCAPPLPPRPPPLVGVTICQGGNKKGTADWRQSYIRAFRRAWEICHCHAGGLWVNG